MDLSDAALWQRVQDVFAETIELPPEARPTYLAAACAGNAELLAEVESLVAAHVRGAGFIEPVPERIGPYRLLDEIAHGGMGAVYRASRDRGEFQQHVAIKILSIAASPSLHRRFVDEQQILATLSHPNVARLLDGGVTRAGVPYIVMELIDGVPIDRFCRELAMAERLRLFRSVCAAVHYAHQHLVVHRDLKPANILVTADGTPKLLDFGVAKMLGADQHGVTIVPAMTPEYASPEQRQGGPVSTAADIYSLGVVLHELLTGRRPDRPLRRGTLPSPDLDAIVAKATRQEPADRYPSAEALAADLERFLSNQPVEARRGAAWYVLSKFAVRHRAAVTAAAVVAAVLAAAVALTVRQSRLAQRRFEDVRQLASSVVFDIHDAVARLPGSTPVRKLIVSDVLTHLDRLSRDAGSDPDLRLELGAAYVRLGDVQGLQSQPNLGDADGAIASYHKARLLLGGVVSRSDRATLAFAEASRHLAMVLMFARRRQEAVRFSADDVAVLEALVARTASDEHRRALVGAYNTLSDADGDSSHRLKAVAIAEELLAKTPADGSRQRDVALMHKNLASPLVQRWAGDRGLPHLRRAEELDAARVAANPANREAQLDLSFDHSQNGMYHFNRENFGEALREFQTALEIRLRLAESDSTDMRLRDRLVYAHTQVGRTLTAMDRRVDALAAFEQAARLSESLLAAEPRHPQYRSNMAQTQARIGYAHDALGRKQPACAAWRTALRGYDDLDRDHALRDDEREWAGELRTKLASCS